MKTLKSLIIENRKNTKPLNLEAFENNKEKFANWKQQVENLRLAVSNYAVAIRTNNLEVLADLENEVYSVYKIVLANFTNKSLNEKLSCKTSDIEAMLTFIGINRKVKNSENGKQFLPASAITFRKSLEDFISDRFTNAICLSAQEIEAIREFNKTMKKAKRKAEKEAQKILKKEKEVAEVAVA